MEMKLITWSSINGRGYTDVKKPVKKHRVFRNWVLDILRIFIVSKLNTNKYKINLPTDEEMNARQIGKIPGRRYGKKLIYMLEWIKII